MTIPTTMRAAVINRFGSSDQLSLDEEHSVPDPASNQVLIQVKAAGINPLDWRIRRGDLRFFLGKKFPMVLGNDVSGVIVKTGADVKEFKVGDEVYCMIDAAPKPLKGGFAKPGAYAEYALSRQDTVALKPRQLTFQQAAVVPLAALTAYQVLSNINTLISGSRVLINGASGGVGSYAVQIAKALGAEVTGICSRNNIDFVRSLGADHVISYQETSIADIKKQYDVIYDVAANSSYRQCKHALTDHGIYICNVANLSTIVSALFHSVSKWFGRHNRNQHAWVRSSSEDLKRISALIEAGKLMPQVEHAYPLEKIKEAHEQSETGHVKGKIVIRLD